MGNERTKTYEEFRDELKDRNFLILANDIVSQLDRYAGVNIHDVKKFIGILYTYIYLHKKGSKLIDLEGTIQEVLLNEKNGKGLDESLLKRMYEEWRKGVYSL